MLTPDQAYLILIINDNSAKWENVRIYLISILNILNMALIIIYLIMIIDLIIVMGGILNSYLDDIS